MQHIPTSFLLHTNLIVNSEIDSTILSHKGPTHPMYAMIKCAVVWFTKKPTIVMTMPNGKVQELIITILPGGMTR